MKKLNLLALFLGCLTVSVSASAKPTLAGRDIRVEETTQWGGEGISMQVTKRPKFHASIKFDCAVASVDEIKLDKKGGFLASGTFTRRSGVRPPNDPVAVPAHFVGFAKNGEMSLMVVLDHSPGNAATYSLVKGSFGHVVMCQ